MKKELLIVYSKMIVGGSTTSLLSLLNEIDYTKYDVELLLLEKGGALYKQIPPEVKICDNTYLQVNKKTLFYVLNFMKAYIKSKICKNQLIRSQLMSKVLAKSQPMLEKEYDVAIAYLEFWASNYVYYNVNAKKRLLWLHCDYKGAKLNPKYDMAMYNNVDTVVTVSNACKENFESLFPSAKSVVTINNILSQKTIRSLANEFCPSEELYKADIVFVTVARIDFNSKGYDRGVQVFKKIKQLHFKKTFKWLIVGDGQDKALLEDLIKSAELTNEIVLLGEKTNPHPYVKMADIFFMPSRYEGKPMAVTEAQMNGVVPFVTDYASAKGQIQNMQDGLICQNNDEAIVEMMKKIFAGKIDIEALKKKVAQTDYSNSNDVDEFYSLI